MLYLKIMLYVLVNIGENHEADVGDTDIIQAALSRQQTAARAPAGM